MIANSCGRIDYDECGSGPTVVLVPGSCSTGGAWRPVIAEWQNEFRCVTTSLLGYGGTEERRTAMDAGIAHEAEILETVIQRAAGPVHLVGHSFGGLAALAVAFRKKVPLLSLTIIEAPAPEFLRHMGEHQHYRSFVAMTDDYFAAFHAGEPNAIAPMIDFYGGTGTFASWPDRVRDYAVRTTPVNMLDWIGAYDFRPTLPALAGIRVPALVVVGGASHPAVKRVNELLGLAMPKGLVATIDRAAHFLIATHARQAARLIGQHVRHAEQLLHAPRRRCMNSSLASDEKRSFVKVAFAA